MNADPTQLGHDARERLQNALGSGFEVRRLLGQGGFAEVYACWDTSLKREVAVKVLRRDLAAEPVLAERFRREAEAVARLRHPNIIPIYSVGEGDGLSYIVMPLVEGDSLRTWMEKDPRPSIDEVRRILAEAADALAEAHRHDIVHRDIKPDNIMLEGENRRVLVMDFGIAKAMSEVGTGLTATGMIIGTPQYMSPEQGSGEGNIDRRSDIYSLGIVGFQMITGQLPFAGNTVVALLIQHATDPPPPIRDLRPDCPADLARAVQRCLAKDPAARWQGAGELRDALTGARPAPAIEGVPERPSGPLVAPHDAGRRFRVVALAAVAVALVSFPLDALVVPGIQFAPFVAAVALFVVLAAYGKLCADGSSWRDALGRASTGHDQGAMSSDEAEFGEYLVQLKRVRADRAALLSSLARLPNSERAILEDILPAADRLLAQATTLAHKMHQLDRSLAKGVAQEDQATAESRRRELSVQFTTTADAMHQVRSALRRVATEGPSSVGEGIREVVRGATLGG